jgi:protein-disulfide isomerase/uncharacterized membrane protein
MTNSTARTPKIRLALLPLFSVIGAGSAVYLAKHYYELRAGTAGFQSLCNINSTMNCDAVTLTRFAEVVPGLPLASLVAGWFAALVILALMARINERRREVVLVGTLMAGFGTLYSIALLAVMFFVIRKFCLFCLIIDAVNFALFATYLSLLKDGTSESVFGGAQWKKIQSSFLMVIGVMFITAVLLRPSGENKANEPSDSEIRYAVNQILEKPAVPVNTPEGAAIMGDPNAPITIHEFSDFQCPFCRRGAVLMHQLLARYPNKIRIVYMPFPLDNSCNRLITRPMHPYSCALARSAYCAGKVGKFQAVYEKIFEDQETLTAESATKIPASFGVGAEILKACDESEDAKKALSLTIEEGIRLGVSSTPTFYINGKKVEVSLPLEAWDLLIAGVK